MKFVKLFLFVFTMCSFCLAHQGVPDYKPIVVNFDASLLQAASHDLLEDCLKQSNQRYWWSWNLVSTPEKSIVLYNFFKNLYQKNNPVVVSVGPESKIPKIIHQIWIQGKVPEKYKQWQQTWQYMFPGWEYKLWTDKEIKALPLKNREIYQKITTYVDKSNLARFEILNLFGGIYVDFDYECLKSEAFDFFNRAYTFYVGISPLDEKVFYCNTAIVASVKGHPILENLLHDIPRQFEHYSRPNTIASSVEFSKKFWRYADQPGYVDIALPPSYFYPIGLESPVDSRAVSLKEETVGIHYWDGTWTTKPR